ELMEAISAKKEGDQITLSYKHGEKDKETTGKLIYLKETKKAGIGITLVDHTELETDEDIVFHTENIGGPSAGLMFTLELYSLFTDQNLRQTHQIAGTGTISADGTVGRIGGIDKKVVGAEKAGAEIFFAPDDEITAEMKKLEPKIQTNYQEALAAKKRLNLSIKIVPIKTVDEALQYLEKLK